MYLLEINSQLRFTYEEESTFRLFLDYDNAVRAASNVADKTLQFEVIAMTRSAVAKDRRGEVNYVYTITYLEVEDGSWSMNPGTVIDSATGEVIK